MTRSEIYHALQKEYGAKSDVEGFRIIAGDYLVIALAIQVSELFVMKLTGALFALSFLGICLVLASRYRGLEILVHEASHNNVFRTRRFNQSMQFLFAYPVFLHVQTYAKIHLEHHQLIGDFEKDPDILIYKKWGLDKLPDNKLLVLFLRPMSFFFTWDHLRTTFYAFWKTKADRPGKIIFWAVVIGVIAVFNLWYYFAVYYLVPFYLLLPILRFYARANEHTGVDFSVDSKSARNNLGLFNRFILHPHGDGYHQVHHLAASIPFFNLPGAHKFLVKHNVEFLDSYNPVESLKKMEQGCIDVLSKSDLKSKPMW